MSSITSPKVDTISDEDRDEALQTFICWLKENDFSYDEELVDIKIISRSKIKESDIVAPVYGVVAKKDITEGTRLCNIPHAGILSAKSCGIADIIEQEDYDGMFALTVSLFYEMSLGERSPWSGYVMSLPMCLMEHDSPVLWSKQRLKCLKGTDVYNISLRSFNFLKDDYKSIIRPLLKSYPMVFDSFTGQSNRLNFRNFVICATQVKAKAYKIGNTYGLGLVPLVDLFNVTTKNPTVSLVSGAYICADCGKPEAFCVCELTDDWENDGNGDLDIDGVDQDSTSAGIDKDIELPPPIALNIEAKDFDSNLSPFIIKQQKAYLELVANEDIPAGKEVLCYCPIDKEVALELGWRYFDPDCIDSVILYDEVESTINEFCGHGPNVQNNETPDIPETVLEEIKNRIAGTWKSRKTMWKVKFFCAVKRNLETYAKLLSQIVNSELDRSTYASKISDIADQDHDTMYDYFPLPGEEYTDNDIYLSQKMDIHGYPSPELLMYLHILLISGNEYESFHEYPGALAKYVLTQFLRGWLSNSVIRNRGAEYSPSNEDTLSSYIIYTSTLKRLQKYPRSLQSDIKHLKQLDSEADHHLFWALLVRIREIEILSNALRSKTCLLDVRNG